MTEETKKEAPVLAWYLGFSGIEFDQDDGSIKLPVAFKKMKETSQPWPEAHTVLLKDPAGGIWRVTAVKE